MISKKCVWLFCLLLILFNLALSPVPVADAVGLGQIDRLSIDFSVPPIVCGEVAALRAGTSTPGCSITGMVWYDIYGQPMTGSFSYDNATVVISVSAAPGYYFSGSLQVDIDGQYAPFENHGSQLVISRTFSPVVWAPNIVKHPGSETVQPGGLASFVSYASFTNESQWTIIDTEGKHYSVQSISEKFPGVAFYAEYSKLNISPVPQEMNGYKVRCTFTGPGGSVDSGYAQINIEQPEQALEVPVQPEPTPEHKHTYSSELFSDAGSHWYECACGETFMKTEHKFTWLQKKAATVNSSGLVYGECSVCGYEIQCSTELAPEVREELESNEEIQEPQSVESTPNVTEPYQTEDTDEREKFEEIRSYIKSILKK